MADDRSKDDPTPEEKTTPEVPPAAPAPEKPDLRVSSRQDLGVNVSRDLNASGWLARGDRSHMSKLKFSVQAKPRDELDPELQALRNPPPAPRSRDVAAAKPTEAESAPPPSDTAVEPAPPPETSAEKPEGLLGRLGRLFGGE